MTELLDPKATMRRAAYDARNAQPDKDPISEIAVASLMQLPEYQAARTILWYIDCRSELRTKHALPAALESGKQIIVPVLHGRRSRREQARPVAARTDGGNDCRQVENSRATPRPLE